MAIFSCVNSQQPFSTIPRSKSGSSARPGIGTGSRPSNSNGPARVASARDLSGRPAGQIKLQKRARVSKAMIGGPSNFQHLTHMDKKDANRVRGSKEMAEITAALQLPHNSETNKENIADVHLQGLGSPIVLSQRPSSPATSPLIATEAPLNPLRSSEPIASATANAKRKAPPPVTQSIIKAAGLPAVQQSGPVPPLPNAVIQARQTNRRSMLPVKLDSQPQDLPATAAGHDAAAPVKGGQIITSDNRLAPPESIGNASMPPSNSFIQRTAISDIERILDAPPDGLPSSSEAAGQETLALPTAPGVPMPAYVPPASDERGTVRSTTYQNLAISPSMENVLSAAVTVEEKPSAPLETKEKRAGPLEYMTDSTKAKWDGQMQDIARQLREDAS